MTTPRVTEITPHLEAVVDDPFIDALDSLRRRGSFGEDEPLARLRDHASGAWRSGLVPGRRARRAAAL